MTKLSEIINIQNSLNEAIVENINSLKDDSEIKFDAKKVRYARKKIQVQLLKSLDLDPHRFQTLYDFSEFKDEPNHQTFKRKQQNSLSKRPKRIKFDSSKNVDSINKRNFYFNDKIRRMFK